jgi:hypothetical protein
VPDVSFVHRHCGLARFEWDVRWRNHCLDVETAPAPETSASFRRVQQRRDKQQFAGFILRLPQHILPPDAVQATRLINGGLDTDDYKQLQMQMARHGSF